MSLLTLSCTPMLCHVQSPLDSVTRSNVTQSHEHTAIMVPQSHEGFYIMSRSSILTLKCHSVAYYAERDTPLSLRMAGRRAYRQSAAAGGHVDLPGTPERLDGRRPGPAPLEDTRQHGGDIGR